MDRNFAFVVGLVGSLVFSLAAAAESPRVAFDMPFVVACRDVTPQEFSAAHPNDRLVEVKFPISTLLKSGSEQDLQQLFYRLESPLRTMSVVDYLPKTAHESRLAGNLEILDKEESSNSLGIDFSGHYHALEGGLKAGLDHKNSSSVNYQLLPPLETVTASGTLMRGSGVYFKLKGSQRNLLEGEREFAVILRTPRAWRADYVHLRCDAEGVARGLVHSLDQPLALGARDFLVGLYLEGDEAARQTAENFCRAEAELRSIAVARSQDQQRRSHATLAKPFGAMFDSPQPAVSKDWLSRLLFGSLQATEVPQRLPSEVREAAGDFITARVAIGQLTGWALTRQVSTTSR